MRNYGSYAQAPPKFIAGVRCLDFLNTTEDGGVERLTSYAEFVIWSKAAGLIDAAGQRRLLALAAKQPQAAAKALTLVLETRAALAGLFRGSVPQRTRAMAAINEMLAQGRFVMQLESGKSGLRQRWKPDGPELRQPLLILLREAAELLSAPTRAHIHHCAGDDCGWFFLDTSRNQSRRWCEMETCGNKAKARAHYHRQRAVS
jgi:predicted RNA-binding Zn ribbon-like protein